MRRHPRPGLGYTASDHAKRAAWAAEVVESPAWWKRHYAGVSSPGTRYDFDAVAEDVKDASSLWNCGYGIAAVGRAAFQVGRYRGHLAQASAATQAPLQARGADFNARLEAATDAVLACYHKNTVAGDEPRRGRVAPLLEY